MAKKDLSNVDIVTLAVYALGGELAAVDTEDVAMKVSELAPGRFSWRKYPDQVNLELVRVRLSEAKGSDKGSYLIGSGADGWLLTPAGVDFCRSKAVDLHSGLARAPQSRIERSRKAREYVRITTSDAYEKFLRGEIAQITRREAEEVFRIDEYVPESSRQRKIARLLNSFRDDSELEPVLRQIARLVGDNIA